MTGPVQSAYRLDLVEKAHHQCPAAEEVDLLDPVEVVAGALLDVRVPGDPDEGDDELVAVECVGQRRSSPGMLESA